MSGPLAVPRFTSPVDATVRPPGSKSETIRALTAAALATGRSHLRAPLDAEDPRAMADALRGLGVDVGTTGDTWTVDGGMGRLLAPERPLDANESGLSARILLALAGSVDGASRLVGRGRLPQRPMGGIVDVLRAQGVEVSGDRLPIDVTGHGPLPGGDLDVDCSESSQFATAVLLVSPVMREPARITLRGLSGSRGYLEMTESIMTRFRAGVSRTADGYEVINDGYHPSEIAIEPDASAAVYPMGMAAVTGGRVTVEGLGTDSRQPDLKMAEVLAAMGCRVEWEPTRVSVDARGARLAAAEVDMSAAPDAALALAVVCLFATGASRISGLESLRHKESDRLEAISDEIARIGGDAAIDGDALVVRPGALHGAVVDPHGDHRIAMAMTIAGITLEEFAVADAHVVNKTWPGFWDATATLGVT